MKIVKTPNTDKPIGPKKSYRIVQYPDADSKSGKVFFMDRRERRKFLGFIPYWGPWTSVKWTDGSSIHWFDFKEATRDAELIKAGKKLYSK